MRDLENVNLTFGDYNNPSVITTTQVNVIVKLAEKFNANEILGSCSGWVSKDNGILTKSQFVLLQNAGVRVKYPTFENCRDDSFIIDSIAGRTVYEGQSIALASNNMSNDVLTYSMSPSTDIRIISKDEDTTDSYIKSHIKLVNNTVQVTEASQNDNWVAEVTVYATPRYTYVDINGNNVSASGAPVATVLNVVTTAVTGITISGPDMVNQGDEAVYTATVVPANSTKQYTSIEFTSLQGGFDGSNVYTIKGNEASDTLTATITLYGTTLTATKTITLGVELMNDTDKNPQMFAIIKSALGLGDDVHSFSVVDAMQVDNAGANSIFAACPTAQASAVSFSEFQYFTGVSEINTYVNTSTYRHFSTLKFPTSLKRVRGYFRIYDDFDVSADKGYNLALFYNQSDTQVVNYINVDGNLSLSGVTIEKPWSNGSTTFRCNKLLSTPKAFPANYGSTIGFYIRTDEVVDLTEIFDKGFTVPITIDSNTVVIPEGVRNISFSFVNCYNLTYFRNSVDGADSVNLPASINTLGQNVFNGCISLQMTNVSNIKNIGNSAFYGCSALNVQELGENLTYLGTSAFSGCINSFRNNVVRLHVPNTKTSLAPRTLTGSESPTGFGYVVTPFYRKLLIKCAGNNVNELINRTSNETTEPEYWFDFRELPALSIFGGGTAWKAPFLNFVYQNRIVSLSNTTLYTGVQRIYVPDALVSNYKAATNWTSHASKIYGESQFVADALASGVGVWDSDNNEWTTHPFDDVNSLKYGLPTWTLAADV